MPDDNACKLNRQEKKCDESIQYSYINSESNINNVLEENLSEVDINEVKKIVDNIIKEEEELFRRNMSKLEIKEEEELFRRNMSKLEIKEEEEQYRRNMNKLEMKEKHKNANENNDINLLQKDTSIDENISDDNLDKIDCHEINNYEE